MYNKKITKSIYMDFKNEFKYCDLIDIEEYDLDYLIIDNNNTSNYLCGNFIYISNRLDTFLKNKYNFFYDKEEDLLFYLLECYNILNNNIIIENINCVNFRKYYNNLYNNLDTEKIRINNYIIDFSNMDNNNFKKKFKYRNDFNKLIINRLKLNYDNWDKYFNTKNYGKKYRQNIRTPYNKIRNKLEKEKSNLIRISKSK